MMRLWVSRETDESKMKIRYIIETECEDIIEMINVQVKCGRAKLIPVDGYGGVPVRSEEEIRDAILKVLAYFAVKSQWVAVYRILVDYCGFPSEVKSFCQRIKLLMRGYDCKFTCNYQSVQKSLASKRILQKPYSDWEGYVVKDGERFFARQKMIADKLFELLRGA